MAISQKEESRRSLRATKTPGHKAEHMVTHREPLKLAVKKKNGIPQGNCYANKMHSTSTGVNKSLTMSFIQTTPQ